MNHWERTKLNAGDLSAEREAQLLLHEVLHVLYSPEVKCSQGLVKRDHLAELLVAKFKTSTH